MAMNLGRLMVDRQQLTTNQQAILDNITSCHPSGAFDECSAVLLRYVHVADQAATLDAAIDQYRECPTNDPELRRFERLLTLRYNTTNVLVGLARSLRITQHARFGPRKAARMSRGGNTPRPWEQ